VKKGVIILLSIVIVSLSFKDFFTYAHFYLNNNFIVNNICINRNTPEVECNGKCYLKKSIKENQEQEKKIPNPAKEKKSNFVFFPISKNLLSNTSTEENSQQLINFFIHNYSFSYHKEIFHPPPLIFSFI